MLTWTSMFEKLFEIETGNWRQFGTMQMHIQLLGEKMLNDELN